jgi:hypothetical protein
LDPDDDFIPMADFSATRKQWQGTVPGLGRLAPDLSVALYSVMGLIQGDVRMERNSALIQGESVARVPL